MTITFQEESYKVIFTPEFMELMLAHYKEVGGFKDSNKIKLAPNWDLYRTLGKNGNIVMFTIRDDKMLIGYNFYMVASHPHYRNSIIAEADSLYLIPKFRKGYTGYKLIKYSIDKLKKRVDAITLNTHVDFDFKSIAIRLGFKPLEQKFVMEV